MRKKFTMLLAALLAFVGVAKAQTLISDATQLSNEKVYTVKAANNANTGAWSVAADGSKMSLTIYTNETADGNTINQRFAFLQHDGHVYLYSLGAKKFVKDDGTGQALTETVSSTHYVTFAASNETPDDGHSYVQAEYPMVVFVGGGALCSSNAGHFSQYGGIVTNWNNKGDSGNAVAIVEHEPSIEELALLAEGYGKLATIDLTVNYSFDGKEVGSQLLKAQANLPFSIPAFDYTKIKSCKVGEEVQTVTDGACTITAPATNATVTVELEANLPFMVSTGYDNATWYALQIRTNKYLRKDGDAIKVSTASPNTEDALWAFMGDPFTGITVLNKAAGAGFTLANDNGIKMKDGEAFVWNIYKGNGGFMLREGNTGNNYIHNVGNGEGLGYWNDNATTTDNGTAFVVKSETDMISLATAAKSELMPKLDVYAEASYYTYSNEAVSSAKDILNNISTPTTLLAALQAKAAVESAQAALGSKGTEGPKAGDIIRLKNRTRGGYIKHTQDGDKFTGTDDATDLATLWAVEEGDESGKVKLRNYATNKYIGEIRNTANAKVVDKDSEHNLFAFTNQTDCYAVFKETSGGDGAYGHMSNGNPKVLIGYNTGDVASHWIVSNVRPLTITYRYNEEVLATVTEIVEAGTVYTVSSPIDFTAPSAVTVGETVVNATDGVFSFEPTGGETVTVELVESLPFTKTELNDDGSFPLNAVWYVILQNSTANSAQAWKYDAENGVTTEAISGITAYTDNHLWCFAGSKDDLKIYNKVAGSAVSLTNTDPASMIGVNNAVWKMAKSADEATFSGKGPFCLQKGDETSYLNLSGGRLKYYGQRDKGSTIRVAAYLSVKYMFKGVELTEHSVNQLVELGSTHTITNPYANKYVNVTCAVNGNRVEAVDGQWTVNVSQATSVIVTITEDLPFKTSTDYATANWQYLQIHSGAWEYVRNDGEKPYSNTTNANELDNGALWAFVGDALNGFKILNQKAGEGYTLNYDGTIVDGTVAYMKQEEKTWTIEKGNGGFVIRQGSNECLNDFNNELKVWKADASPNNNGSAFRTFSAGVKNLSELYNSNIYVLQAERSPLMYDAEAENPNKLSSGMANNIAANANDANQQFVIFNPDPENAEGPFCLYSVGAAKFVDANLNFTDYPEAVLTFEANPGNPVFPWFVKIDGKYVVPGSNGTAGNKIFHTETPDPDAGKWYRIEKVDDDISLATGIGLIIQQADGLIRDVNSLNNDKVYNVYTYDRGAWYYNSEQSHALWSTGKTAIAGGADANVNQFAFLTVNGKTYLYSVGAQKFVVKSTDATPNKGTAFAAFSDVPSQSIEFLPATNGRWYPVVVKLNGIESGANQLHISNGYDCPVILYDNLAGTGNQVRIEEAGAFNEETLNTLLATITAYQIDTEARGGLQDLIDEATTLLGTLPAELTEAQTLSTAKDEAQAVLDQSEPAATYEQMMEKKESLATALAAVQEYPFINGMLKELTAGSYLIYYTDGEGTKHYLKTSAANSVITVADNPEQYPMPYEVTVTSVRGKYSKAYALKMNNLYISNTSQNASNIETKTNEIDWSTQAIFEKDGKCAIRLTNAIDNAQGWHGHWFIGKGEAEGTTIAKDPEVATLEDLFIWKIEPYTKSDAQIAADALGQYLAQLPTDRNIAPGVNNYSQPAEDRNFDEAKTEVQNFYNAITRETSADLIKEKKEYLEDLESRITINMPENGKFYRVRCTGSGMKYLQSTLDKTNERDIRLKVLSSATGVDATFCYVDGALLSYTTGLYINAYRFNEVGVKSDVVFTGASNGTYGRYNIKVGDRWIYGAHTEEGKVNKIDSGTGEQAGSGDGYTWWLEEVKTLPVTVTTAGWATLYAPVALTIPNGVEAVYTGTVVDNYLDLTAIEGGTIPANTGVVIKANAGTYNFTIAADVDEITDNDLTGKYPKSAKNDGAKVYTLQNGTNGVGFYLFNGTDGTNTTYINGFRAWVELEEASAPANALRIRFAGTTGIENSEIDAQGAQIIFDLTGRRIEKIVEKGIYIVNGKKVIVK